MSEFFTTFFENLVAQPLLTWIAIAGLIIFSVVLLIISKNNYTTRAISVGAICIAISFVLSTITLFKMPQGGSITPASMLPIVAYAWVFGPAAGMAAGLIHGLIQLIQGAYIVHPIQFMFDYILPFALLGTAGFFKKKNFILAIIVACFARFLMHFISGFVFWGEYAPAGQAPWLYSLIYNGSYMLPETVICIIIAIIPSFRKALLSLDNGIK